MKPNWISLSIAISTLAIIALVSVQYTDCKNIGGTFVRGIIWFVCVK